MKTIGLIGGMSWESTVSYYQAINQQVKQRLGGLHSAKIILNSVDFHEIEQLQASGEWHEAGEILANAASSVEVAGADIVVVCTNTMHKVADQIADAVTIPLLHIADATGEKLIGAKLNKVALLGTAFTMEQDFYKQRLIEKFGMTVLIPEQAQRQQVHEIIYQELCLGKVKQASKSTYLAIINELANQGAEAIILGCTEIGMLVQSSDCNIPIFDTTAIHAQAAVNYALKD